MRAEAAKRLSPSGKRIDAHAYRHFDVLRGVSALAVFVTHTHTVLFIRFYGADSPAAVISGWNGRLAVIIFLLLSGYLITQSIRLNIERNGRFNFTEYAIARIARIHPPLIGAIMICVLVGAIIAAFALPGDKTAYGLPGDLYRAREHYSLSGRDIISSLLMVQGLTDADGPLWTLYVEFQMYVAAMGVAVWFGKSPEFRPGLLILSALAAALALLHPAFASIWMIGAITNLASLNRKTAMTIAGVLGVLVGWMTIHQPGWITAIDSPDANRIQFILAVMLSCTLLIAWPRLDYPAWLVATGGFSYSLYVIHWPLLLLTLSLGQEWMGHSPLRTSLVALSAGAAVIGLSMGFAAVFERQDFFRSRLKALFQARANPPLAPLLSPADPPAP